MSNYAHGNLQKAQRNTSWTKIFEYVPNGSTVLDFGCSTGELGQALKAEKNCTVYGVELDEGDLKEAKKRLDGAYNFNVEQTEIPKALSAIKFDVIIFADVIEHLVNPIQALAKVRSLLKPGGRLVFSLPNMSHMSVRLQLLSGRLIYNETGLLDKTHLHFYDFEEVQRVLKGAGYQIVENDANVLTYTPAFLQKKLADIGLKDNGFIEKSKTDLAAQSFQFVGYATAAHNSKPKDVVLTTNTPEKDLSAYIENLADDNKVLETNLRKANEELTSLHQKIAVLNEENRKLRQRSPRVIAKKIARKIAPKKRP